MNCKGKKKREWIVKNYYVYPISHLKLLKGQFKQSDAEAKITDHYYIFNIVDKRDKTKKDIICCGYKVAKHFEKLTGKVLPKLFSPVLSSSKDIKSSEFVDEDKTIIVWNETRLQLYNAVMLIITLWNAKPSTDLFTIKYYLENYTYLEPPMQKIKGVNTILRNSKKTLRSQLNEVSKNNYLKNYKFDLIVEKLKNEGIIQYFENEDIEYQKDIN